MVEINESVNKTQGNASSVVNLSHIARYKNSWFQFFIKSERTLVERHTFLGLLAKIKGKFHHSSLLLGSSRVAFALHFCIGLAHPTKTSPSKCNGLAHLTKTSPSCISLISVTWSEEYHKM
ncbi:hypothetical protein DCAR_0103149 [Daucus carota subsp. sativus]|uniref:Uncharacterized protein n=1 Tax=Daucus carota subsp. sativus TaxID=79200 RepID=A0AAF1AL10_DAUCS|nr:hypothetical protein DCAR_0103149 [Daucus carota subsp. sativus]